MSDAHREMGELIANQPLGGECENPRCQQIAATASDVYCTITGGLLSYPTYDARTILTHYEDDVTKTVDEETATLRAELAEAIAQRDQAQRFVVALSSECAHIETERDAALLAAEVATGTPCWRCGGEA